MPGIPRNMATFPHIWPVRTSTAGTGALDAGCTGVFLSKVIWHFTLRYSAAFPYNYSTMQAVPGSSTAPGAGENAPAGDGSIMVIAAHPDDMESWCAGTLVLSIEAGAHVRLLLVTSGDKGTSDPLATIQEVATRREEEAQEAARRLGITEVAFLRYPDGDVEDTRTLRGELVEWIRRWQPNVLFTHDPEHPYPPYITHRDHRIVGRLALDAAYPLARDRLSFPEHLGMGLEPCKVSQVWLFSSATPNIYVDITKGFGKKIAARLAHESQTADPVALAASWRRRAADIGRPAGLALAEAFTVIRLD